MGTAGRPKSRGVGRTRVFAIVVYADSAPDDWRERLVQEHVQALISPYHDQDVNPDGTQKKPHWHVLILFEGVKTEDQVNEMLDRVLGPNRVKVFENVQSTRGYARYLCHLDNPEKAQYDKADVEEICGADYEELITLASSNRARLKDIMAYVRTSGITYYHELMDYCMENEPDWWALLVERYSYVVMAYMSSLRQRNKDIQDELRAQGYDVQGPDVRTDPATGEILSMEDMQNDCQD